MTLQLQSPPVANKNIPLNADSVAPNLSDLLVAYLELLGVEYVFGVPGGHISALYEALNRSAQRGGPRAILARHETGAAHMAAGYARATGKLGVCCATTSPGASNLITGLMGAYADHTPLLAITAQSMLSKFGAAAFQESSPDTIDTTAMLGHCTLYNTIITHQEQAEQKIVAALRHALQPPGGPVHVSLPVDLSRVPMPGSFAYPHLLQSLATPSAFVNPAAVEQLWQRLLATLRQERQVVIWVGHECAGATAAIMRVAELLNARVITTQRGKSWIDPYHPLSAGVFGFAGHASAREALTSESVDLILAAGVSLGQWATSTWDKALLNEKLVHIHPINKYFDRSPMACLHVHGSVSLVFEALLERLESWQAAHERPVSASASLAATSVNRRGIPPQIQVRESERYHSNAVPIHPQRLMWEMMQRFPPETRFLCDNCNWLAWSFHHFFIANHRNFHSTGESVMSMGWAIGASVGMALATRGTPVVCLAGDGCFLMNGQEITVAVEERVPVIYVILNDGGYGMVKHRHRQVAKQPLEFSFSRVDFARMAEAMGATGYAIHTIEDLQSLDFAAICRNPGPTVIDVHIDPEAIPPMGMY
jgi:acetolactate synthase I/II/III large subunit